jgi:hypothetical protein
VGGVDKEFEAYFEALDRAGGKDHCYLCRRTAAEVKRFFGFEEDGVPRDAAEHGIEDVILDQADIMSYRGLRPICAVCQLNFDAIFMLEEHATLALVLKELENDRDRLWPDGSESPEP